tara:strand:+ start:1025 stop:1798 length:774 start_codon:yes stop_codon:yes gene_type:complete
MSINSNVNKQMLLEICGGIDNKCMNDNGFLNFLNNVCDRYQSNRFDYSNIQDINKNILEELVYYMNQPVNNEIKKESILRQRPQEMNRELKTIDAIDLKVQRDEGFSIKLKSREEAFKTLIEKPAPPAVDFADKNQDLPSQNLDVLMNQSLADREKELQMILNNQPDKKAKDWLKPIETSENKNKEEKKVRFEEPTKQNNEMVNFLSKLKTTNENNNNISNDENIKLLREILENQREILEILKKGNKDISRNNINDI